MLTGRSERIALAIVRPRRVSRDHLENQLGQHREELRRRRAPIALRIGRPGCLDRRRRPLELVEQQGMSEDRPAVDDHGSERHDTVDLLVEIDAHLGRKRGHALREAGGKSRNVRRIAGHVPREERQEAVDHGVRLLLRRQQAHPTALVDQIGDLAPVAHAERLAHGLGNRRLAFRGNPAPLADKGRHDILCRQVSKENSLRENGRFDNSASLRRVEAGEWQSLSIPQLPLVGAWDIRLRWIASNPGPVLLQFNGTPYVVDPQSEAEIVARLRSIEDRVALLRGSGTLTGDTIRDYYGEKRFEQVAESNAIEGSTLSVGETELAVLKGVTITGHDPAFVRDAVSLDRALNRIAQLARQAPEPTDIAQICEVHAILLEGRSGAGFFRTERVTIRGSDHRPPKTLAEIELQMAGLEEWSFDNASLPAPIRSAVIHAWLTHIHPFIDGNGRTSRAFGNLELIKAGYPPIILRKKERDRYIDALAASDSGGDIRSFFDIIFERIDGSLTGLEHSARKRQGYSPFAERLRIRQQQQITIWETSVRLLGSIIQDQLTQMLEPSRGVANVKFFDHPVDLDDFIDLCEGRSISGGWAFAVQLAVPGLGRLEKLAFIGHRSARMYQALGQEGGPALYWSRRTESGFPKWERDGSNSPYAVEATSKLGNGDAWMARLPDERFSTHSTTDLAELTARALIEQIPSP